MTNRLVTTDIYKLCADFFDIIWELKVIDKWLDSQKEYHQKNTVYLEDVQIIETDYYYFSHWIPK